MAFLPVRIPPLLSIRGTNRCEFTDYHAKVHIIYIEVPFKTLKTQNHNRTHKVPFNVIEKMIGKLEIPTLEEAHEVKYMV